MSVAKEVVLRTPTESDAIMIVLRDRVLYASRGQYGGWIIKESVPELDLKTKAKILWCFKRGVREVEAESVQYEEVRKFVEKLDEYKLPKPMVREVRYFYHPAKVVVKKLTDKYVVIDVVPEDTVVTATAVHLYWSRHYTRGGYCTGHLCDEDAQDRVKLLGKMMNVLVYDVEVARRDYELRVKFAVDYAEVEKYLGLQATAPATPQVEETEEVGVEELERRLREVEGESERSIEIVQSAPQPRPATPATPVTQIQQATKCDEEYERLVKEVEELREIVEKRFDDWARKQGLVKLKLVVFTLPTEYLGSTTRYSKDEDGKIVESKILSVDPARARTLRKKFYEVLHSVAYRIHDMWALRHDADLSLLNEVISNINEEFKNLTNRRTIELIDAFFPKDYVVRALTEYIEERKASMAEIYEKLNKVEKARDRARLLRELEELKTEIESLQRELRYLSSL
jgi:hypothetical protein